LNEKKSYRSIEFFYDASRLQEEAPEIHEPDISNVERMEERANARNTESYGVASEAFPNSYERV